MSAPESATPSIVKKQQSLSAMTTPMALKGTDTGFRTCSDVERSESHECQRVSEGTNTEGTGLWRPHEHVVHGCVGCTSVERGMVRWPRHC